MAMAISEFRNNWRRAHSMRCFLSTQNFIRNQAEFSDPTFGNDYHAGCMHRCTLYSLIIVLLTCSGGGVTFCGNEFAFEEHSRKTRTTETIICRGHLGWKFTKWESGYSRSICKYAPPLFQRDPTYLCLLQRCE